MNTRAAAASSRLNAPTLVDMMFGSDPAALPLIRMLQRPVVIDANVLIEDAMRLSAGRHCALQLAAQIGTARFFAPPQILSEVVRNLPEACGSKHDPKVVLAIIRDRYLPYLSIVNVADISMADPRVASLRTRHAPDVAYAVLALVLAPSVLFTNDRDILDQGLGHYHDQSSGGTGWTYGAVSLQDTALMPVGILGLTATVGGSATLAMATVDVATSLRSRPVALLLAVTVASGLLALALKSETTSTHAQKVSTRVKEAGGALGRAVAAGLGWWGEANQMLDEGAVTRKGPSQPVFQLARLLALSHSSLTVDEIAVAIPNIEDPGALLASHASFVEASPGRWSLGQAAGSWLSAPSP
jgi:hypothetical protein